MDKIFNINLNGQNYEIQDKPLTEQVATLEGEVAGKLDKSAYTPYDDAQVKADIQANTTAIEGKQDKGNYALSGTSYTKAESDAKYLTEHQSLTDYAKTADVNTALADKQDKGDYALKSEIPSVEGLASETYVSNKIKEVVGTAPEALDTLGEIADKLSGDDDAIAAINQVLDGKVSKDEYNTNQQSINNSLTDLSNNKADKSEIPTIPLFRTINGQAITGSTDNIVIESGSDIELPISSDDVAVKGDILTKGKQLSSGDTFTSRYLFAELDVIDGSGDIYFTDNTRIVFNLGKIAYKSPEFSNATNGYNKNGTYVDFGDIVTLTLKSSTAALYIGTTVGTLTSSLSDLNNNKQDALVNGSNIKRLISSNKSQDLLGSGNIYIPTINGHDMVTGSSKSYYVKSINGQSMFGTTRDNINLQPTLVSGTNIKTVNGSSLLGSGNLSVSAEELEADKVKFTTQGEGKVFVKGEEITDGYNNEHVQYILFINDSYGDGLTLTWDGGYSIHYSAFDKNVTFTNVEGTYEKYGEGEYVDDFIVKLNTAIPLNNVSISYDSAMSSEYCHAYIATLEQEVKVETLPEVLTNYYTKTEIDNMVGNINNALNQI